MDLHCNQGLMDHPSNAVRKGKDEKSRRKQTKKTKKVEALWDKAGIKEERKKERKGGRKEGRGELEKEEKS